MAFNAKRNDVSKFTDGTWVEILGGHFKVARSGNPTYEKALEASGYRKKEEPEAKQRALLEAVAVGVLKDWRDVENEAGEPITFSTENAVMVLLENPDLVGRLLSEANDLANFRRNDHGDQAKKPKTSKVGNANSSE